MGKKINMIGKKCGLLTVIDEAPNNKKGDAMWKCQCECGNIIIVKGAHLRSGNSTSCGCKRIKTLIKNNHARMNNIANQKFGLLMALYPNGTNNNRSIIWHCKCDCGNECDISNHDLITGNTKSCGCLKSLIGKKFGKLTVISDSGKRTPWNNTIIWHCKCECGNEIDVNGRMLKENISTHCGCDKKISKGEEKIINILNKNSINYKTQATFSDCFFKDTKKLAKFDFYIDNKYIVEFDGIQHSQVIGWATEDKVKKIQEHDKIKNQYCFEHNIPIIRIPYTHFDNLCLEDLLLETSKFILR